MTNQSIIDTIDPEIVQTLVSRRDAIKRGASISALAAAGLALGTVPLALGALAQEAGAQGTTADIIGVLNFALTLEYLESEFYNRGNASTGLIPLADQAVFAQIAKHENAHVTTLRATISTLGGTPVAKPTTFDFTAKGAFPNPFLPTNYATFQAIAQAFEDTGVRAYKGQAGNLQSNPTVLTAALRIHSVEARHAAEVRRLRGKKGWITQNQTDIPGTNASYAGEENVVQGGATVTAVGSVTSLDAATEAFDEPLTKDQVLAIVTPFIT